MNDNLYRVWEIAHGNEIPVNVIPCDFKSARAVMRLRSLEVCKQLGWRLDSQGLDFAIYNIPHGKQYELRIRMETPEYLAFEALAGITYTVDEGLELVEPREPHMPYYGDPVASQEWNEDDTQQDLRAIDDEEIYGYREGDAGIEVEVANV